VFETSHLPNGPEMSSQMHSQILDEMNLEVVRQLEELTARFRAYEAICTHLYRARTPVTGYPANRADH